MPELLDDKTVSNVGKIGAVKRCMDAHKDGVDGNVRRVYVLSQARIDEILTSIDPYKVGDELGKWVAIVDGMASADPSGVTPSTSP